MGGLCSCLGECCLEEEEEIPSEFEQTPPKEISPPPRQFYRLCTNPLPPGEHPINWEKSSARAFAQCIEECEPMISAVQKHEEHSFGKWYVLWGHPFAKKIS
ncbi:uncharacterized protein LOC144581378 [Callithrix jacchus]